MADIKKIKEDVMILLKSAQMYVQADKWDFLLKSMQQTAKQKYPDMQPEQVQQDLETLKNADITPDKASIRFLVELWKQNKDVTMEQLQNVIQNLTMFYKQRVKPIWKQQNKPTDIMKVLDPNKDGAKSVENLLDLVAEYMETGGASLHVRDESEKKIINDTAQVDHVYNKGDWDVYVPKSEKASIILGRGTSWCTARDDSQNHFKYYQEKGTPLYIIQSKSKPDLKFQFEGNEGRSGGQFMDRSNTPVIRFDWLLSDPNLYEFLEPHLDENQKETIEKNKAYMNMDSQTKMEIILSGDEKKITDLIINVTLTPQEIDKIIELYAQ